MDALMLPTRSASCLISSHKVYRRSSSSRTQYRTDRVSLSSSYSRVHIDLFASFQVADRQQLRSGKGRRSLGARATVATEGGFNEAKLETEEEGANETKLATEEEGASETKLATEEPGVNEAELATEEEGANEMKLATEVEGANETELITEEEGANEPKLTTDEDGANETKLTAEEEGAFETELATEDEGANETKLVTEEEVSVEDVASGSDDAVAQSVEVLKRAAKTRKVPASDICAAFKVIEKAKIDPTDFLSLIGGKKSPGLTWLLIFSSNAEQYNGSQGGGKYFPVTAVQNFDAERKRIENGVYLGPLGELRFSGNIAWEKRKLSFIFHTLTVRVGPLGPFSFGIGSKDKEITKTDPFFIWSYADDEIIVGKGKAGGTAFWVKCARVRS